NATVSISRAGVETGLKMLLGGILALDLPIPQSLAHAATGVPPRTAIVMHQRFRNADNFDAASSRYRLSYEREAESPPAEISSTKLFLSLSGAAPLKI